MNYFTLAAGIVSLIAVFGHFTMGSKLYLKPVKNSDIDEIPIRVMESLFHYMSVFMIITTFCLLISAFNIDFLFNNINDVVLLIGILYGAYAIAQFIIALLSSVKMGVTKMFQWVFWLIISILSIIGVS